ncbi:aminoglycoside 3'-phosphotransferase/choline kinase family protein [Amycolatopsis mongoliensis]|uniref:Aminoglycoside 3'-phosphotransferase/choline kinase family protein n=1 Tax=Amycolatopsis mongoliensis TaxID=715475 RepID=A0A9Y2K067_9PSEU|nr:aminoglycoside 3'-phosphotransferase/choline kinase family protein [Amycolatopsis sp. 4-36]WIY06742.1 aminoglycoside 3'-phosphotransferase/choline kinase family protein [Amycolatopsis sp. 4-36]
MATFPTAATEAEAGALTRESLLPAVTTLLGRDDVVPFTEGSLPVYAVGDDLVLKLYPPVYRDELTTERTMLEVLHGVLPVPEPVRSGERDGWGHLLMTRLPGRTLEEAWPSLSTEDKQRLMPRLGGLLATLHAVDDARLEVLAPKDWTEFVAGQRAKVVDHHRRTGLAEAWVAQIPAFLDTVGLDAPPVVPLHTEFMRDHVMVGPDGRVTGVFDFEPAMRGAAEYDFVAAGLFVSSGDGGLLRRLLDGYGQPIDPRRCLAYALLHVYSDFTWYFDVMPAPPEPTLDALATAWWGSGQGAPE